jgi:hypothetical protein
MRFAVLDPAALVVLGDVLGVGFAAWSASAIADRAPLHFYVDRDGEIVFLDRPPETRPELVERRVRRARVTA